MEQILIYLSSLPNLVVYTMSGVIFGTIAGAIGVLISKRIKSKKLGQIIAIILLVISIPVSNTLVHHFKKKLSIKTKLANKYSKAELINLSIKRIKSEMTLPKKIDDVTTMINVSAEPNAIRYHYILSGVTADKITNSYLKNFLASNVCRETRVLLDEGINVEYSYIIKNSKEKYFVSFSKSDCDAQS